MLPAERRQRILQLANVRGIVSIRELADELKAPEVTVRRDVTGMAAEGVLTRIRGGAMVPPGFAYEPSHAERAGRSTIEKAAIADLAASLVRPGAILLGPGTTVQALARRLVRISGLTVVTNSLLVLDALAQAPNVELLLTGGTLRQSIHALVGPRLEQGLRGLHVSQVFLSGDGVSAERGLTSPNQLVAAADEAMAAAAAEVVVMADHTKLGQETLCQTVPPSRIDVLITDDGADDAQVRRLRDAGITVHIAGTAPGAGSAMAAS